MSMKTYTCHKTVRAKPMTRGDYDALRGWIVPADENPSDDGYLVEYLDGGPANVRGYENYVSWSPKDVFERGYTEAPAPSQRAPHEQRVVDEHVELLGRLQNLRAFMLDGKGRFPSLPRAERARMDHQEQAMSEYADILADRIKAFPQPNEQAV